MRWHICCGLGLAFLLLCDSYTGLMRSNKVETDRGYWHVVMDCGIAEYDFVDCFQAIFSIYFRKGFFEITSRGCVGKKTKPHFFINPKQFFDCSVKMVKLCRKKCSCLKGVALKFIYKEFFYDAFEDL